VALLMNNAADAMKLTGNKLNVTAFPLCTSIWWRVLNPADGAEHRFFELGDNTANNDSFRVLRNSSGTVRTTVKSGGVASSASATVTINDTLWHHQFSLWTSSSSKTVWLDGGSSASNGTFGDPLATIVEAHLGCGTTDGATWFSNIGFAIAYFGLWTADVSAHVDRLARGAHPSTVAPESLQSCADLDGTMDTKHEAWTLISGSANSGCFAPPPQQLSFRRNQLKRRMLAA
jgi:hypothetical protein